MKTIVIKKIGVALIVLILSNVSLMKSQTVNLTTHEPTTTPPMGVIFEWHKSPLPIVPGTLMTAAEIAAANPGVYYGVYNYGTCYSTPSYLRIGNNVCPDTTQNLALLVDSALKPSGMVVSYHTGTPVTSVNRITNIEASKANAGNYFIAYYDTISLCFSTYSPIELVTTTCLVLPVKFSNFTAIKFENTKVLLQFTIAQAAPTSNFTVERSINGTNFTAIGTIAGANTLNYNFIDQLPNLTTKNYYRIKEVDVNGLISYTAVKTVIFNKESKINIYPLPANTELKITFDEMYLNKTFVINLYNQKGQVVLTKKILKAIATEVVNVSKFTNGSYQLVITGNNQIIADKKITIIH